MKRIRKRSGFTMAEVLIVVGIIAVLAGVSFVSVSRYQRSLAQLECDNIAKEIFVAAQNHLVVAESQGYPGITTTELGNSEIDNQGVYYMVINQDGIDPSSAGSMYNMMLPFGSVDATVLSGGSYIIRYQPNPARVLDVFYCADSSGGGIFKNAGGFGHKLVKGDFDTVLGLRGDDQVKVNARRTVESFSNTPKPVLGWCGSEQVQSFPKIKLVDPIIEVINNEQLYVNIKVKKIDAAGDTIETGGGNTLRIRLVVTGNTSQNSQKTIILRTGGADQSDSDARISSSNADPVYYTYKVILDDITAEKRHFAELGSDTGFSSFIPGENITIACECEVQGNAFSNIARSEKTTNSLFADISSDKGPVGLSTGVSTAHIGYIRHLENLDDNVSGVSHEGDLIIQKAKQIDDLYWDDAPNPKTGFLDYFTGDTKVYKKYNSSKPDPGTKKNTFLAINPSYTLSYDGQSHSISNVVVNNGAAAGLFGAPASGLTVKNLELIDFDVTSTATSGGSAGALAGTLNNCTVTNVLARNSAGASTAKITASATNSNAGGLIGKMTSGTVQYSAAAVLVGDPDNQPTNAGGLIGNASGTIIGCYSGGHTKNGSYEEWVEAFVDPNDETKGKHSYDVTGGTVGGLVGTSSATISNSYSTCSVSGTTAGGFAGTASASITNCYATGLVKTGDITGTNNPNTDKIGAFAGTMDGTATSCYYYQVINEVKRSETGNGSTEKVFDHYLGAAGDAANDDITAIDLDTGTYNSFVGSYDEWGPASAYDSALMQYYSEKYPLKSVFRSAWTATYTIVTDTIVTDKTTLSPPSSPATTGLITGNIEVSGKMAFSDLFVRKHYGDWPSPEVFFINTSIPTTPSPTPSP